jgi:glutamate-ammonia-ligase adenylyltransferase
MTLYAPAAPTAASELKGWSAETFYARFTQRLVTALSAQTAEGGLYAVDLQLRPSGKAGPVAVSLSAFRDYYAREAETWEALALTRARVAWASSPGLFAAATDAIVAALRRPRDPDHTAREVLEMRELMRRERPAKGAWDLKLAPGGLVDVEFAVQALQIVHAHAGGPLYTSTEAALEAMAAGGLADAEALVTLSRAFRLQSSLNQLLKLALADDADPAGEPEGFKALLAKAGGWSSFAELQQGLDETQAAARRAHAQVVGGLASFG